MKETPISSLHRQLGARLGTEDGWQMPQQFHSLIEEHLALRSACGVFDISHLAKLSVVGNGALQWLESMLSNNIGTCQDGHAQRTLMLNEKGGIIDKITLMRESAGRFFLLGHAAMAEEDAAWLMRHKPDGALVLQNETDKLSGMALYGPDSEKVFSRVLRGLDMPLPKTFQRVVYQNDELLLTRTGLQGEEGFEMFCPANRGISWFESFISAGAVPCGSTTRENMRLTRACACSCRDVKGRTPHEANLEACCDKEKTYIGSDVVIGQTQSPVERKLVSLRCLAECDTPVPGAIVVDDEGNVVGQITTACTLPDLGRGLALASILTAFARPGTRLRLIINNLSTPVIVSESKVQ